MSEIHDKIVDLLNSDNVSPSSSWGIVEDELLNDDCDYLTLTFTGNDWAATFGCLFDDDEWFEPDNESWPMVAHGKTAFHAILQAALNESPRRYGRAESE